MDFLWISSLKNIAIFLQALDWMAVLSCPFSTKVLLQIYCLFVTAVLSNMCKALICSGRSMSGLNLGRSVNQLSFPSHEDSTQFCFNSYCVSCSGWSDSIKTATLLWFGFGRKISCKCLYLFMTASSILLLGICLYIS